MKLGGVVRGAREKLWCAEEIRRQPGGRRNVRRERNMLIEEEGLRDIFFFNPSPPLSRDSAT